MCKKICAPISPHPSINNIESFNDVELVMFNMGIYRLAIAVSDHISCVSSSWFGMSNIILNILFYTT